MTALSASRDSPILVTEVFLPVVLKLAP